MHKLTTLHFRAFVAAIGGVIWLSGCTVHPPGEREERDAASLAGKPFAAEFANREIPSLPAAPEAKDFVTYAMLSNAELEARYWQWRSAIEQIPQDAEL